MADHQYSQIPVTNDNNQIVGVFTWRSFCKWVYDLKESAKINPSELPLKDLMEPARFISGNVYIDTETDWADIDYVLVGTPAEPLGILCAADVLGRLNDFAEAFVLIYEIEHEIRDLIRDVYTENELANRFEELNLSANRPAAEIADMLQEYIDQHGTAPALGKSLSYLKRVGSRPLESLADFTFAQYASLICSESNWPRFEPVFDRMRELVRIEFEKVNRLRNIVFHFRRGITVGDTDVLRRFRDKLRNDRELYNTGRLVVHSNANG